MSFLSTALDRLMKERDWTQTELERRTGLAQSNISRYLNSAQPDGEALTKLINAFGMPDGQRLLVAYAKDQVPPEFRRCIVIDGLDDIGSADDPPPDDLRERAGPRLYQLFLEILEASKRKPKIISAIETTLEIAREK